MYILDTVPPIHVVSNHVAIDKLTTQSGGMFQLRWASLSSQSRQSMSVTDQAIWTGRNLINLHFTYFCIPVLYVRI